MQESGSLAGLPGDVAVPHGEHKDRGDGDRKDKTCSEPGRVAGEGDDNPGDERPGRVPDIHDRREGAHRCADLFCFCHVGNVRAGRDRGEGDPKAEDRTRGKEAGPGCGKRYGGDGPARDEQPGDDLDALVDPVRNPAEERFCDGDDQHLDCEDDPDLVRLEVEREQVHRQEGLEGAKGKVRCHVRERRCPEPAVSREGGKAFLKHGNARQVERPGRFFAVPKDEDKNRDRGESGSNVHHPVREKPRGEGKGRDDDPAGKRRDGAADERCRRVGAEHLALCIREALGDDGRDDRPEDCSGRAMEKPDRDQPERIGNEKVEQGREEEHATRRDEQAPPPDAVRQDPDRKREQDAGKRRYGGNEAEHGVPGTHRGYEEGEHGIFGNRCRENGKEPDQGEIVHQGAAGPGLNSLDCRVC